MGIVAILAATSLSSLTRSRSQTALRQGSQELASSYRTALSNALSIKNSGSFTGEAFPGYGLYIPASGQSRYWIYADTDGNNKYTASDPKVGADIIIPRGALIKSMYYGVTTTSPPTPVTNDLSVVFERPTPKVHFTSNSSPLPTNAALVAICMGTIDTSLVKMIRIWRTGHVSVSGYGNDCSDPTL